ncbi:GNAT family N-acetyltransferase [Streptomyces spiramyceticus]|uniref:GNAT family N-acetyltransferase n=1 Tax=Streptomyces spiramyceticus TaxID=299717 RepID=UPI00237C3390|nr:GNAT family N-acetyltransferase [Streptomyces spiramyceticus]
MDVSLREVVDSDVPVFFSHMSDPEAIQVAAFVAKNPPDRAAFNAHWARMRASDEIFVRTVVVDGAVAGHAAVYGPAEEREVTYWVDRAYWGRGVATAALRGLLALVPERPLYARAAADNTGSARVLQKCGFVVIGHDRGFANGRGAEVDELVLTLTG